MDLVFLGQPPEGQPPEGQQPEEQLPEDLGIWGMTIIYIPETNQ